jgi:hypothetical protein
VFKHFKSQCSSKLLNSLLNCSINQCRSYESLLQKLFLFFFFFSLPSPNLINYYFIVSLYFVPTFARVTSYLLLTSFCTLFPSHTQRTHATHTHTHARTHTRTHLRASLFIEKKNTCVVLL